MNKNEMFIEGQQVYITSELSSLITFMIDDVNDFGARNTSRSLTIVLPGSSINNQIFGNIFNIKSSNRYSSNIANTGYNFNPHVSARVLIYQDRIQVFKGVLKLQEIIIDRGNIEYEVSVKGELGGFIFNLGSRKLEDLDFSAYNTVFNVFNILASWDTNGSGVYFPLIDYGGYSTGAAGTAKHDWQIQTFRPALYVSEYLDKIREQAKFTWDFPLISTSRFKRLVVPYNKKALTKKGNNLVVAAGGPLSGDSNDFDPLDPAQHEYSLFFTSQSMTSFNVYSDGFSIIGYEYIGTTDIFMTVTLNYSGDLDSQNGVYLVIETFGTGLPSDRKTGPFIGATVGQIHISGTATWTFLVKPNMVIAPKILEADSSSSSWTAVDNFNYDMSIAGQAIFTVDINPGDTIPINDCIPSNILQKDFFVDILKLFNLYVTEDKYIPRKLIITPYPDFYSGEVVDWSDKLNRNKPVRIKPLQISRFYAFKYKQDSDFFNDEYRKRFNIGYGDYTYDSQYEGDDDNSTVQLNFSATPLVGYPGEDKIYSTIFKISGNQEESMDSNIRILQTKKITTVSMYNIMSQDTILLTLGGYGYAGHLDDPDAPSNDINFGVPRELYFTLVSGGLNVNQFNVYYSSYLAEITDKDSRILTGNFWLTPEDILKLDFSKYVYLDGVLFRINKVEDYNATNISDCQVELLKVIKTIY